MLKYVYVWLESGPTTAMGRATCWKCSGLADVRAVGGVTHRDAHQLLQGLFLGHLVGLGALLLHGRAGGLSRGGGSGSGLVLVRLEERHGW